MDLYSRLAQALKAHETVTLITIVSGPLDRSEWVGRKLLVKDSELLAGAWADPPLAAAALFGAEQALQERRPRMTTSSSAGGHFRLYCEPYIPDPVLLIAGGGHVAQKIAVTAVQAGFRVRVVDDRPSFANRERFPGADQVLCAPMATTIREMELGPDCSVVLVTRGHHHDMNCLIEVINRPLGYIGMIGSRTRVETIFEILQTEYGVTGERLASVHAPIGLDIGAESPAEIAVAIVAELIKARRGGTGISLSQMDRRLNRECRPMLV